MIIICSGCATHLQLNDAKVPSRPFTIRCPKCQNVINAQPGAHLNDQSALAIGNSPATEHPRSEQSMPAPIFNPDVHALNAAVPSNGAQSSTESNELARILCALLERGAPALEKQRGTTRPAWDRRRVLVCVTGAHAEAIALTLAENNYLIFVADNTTQAVERMREEHMDIVILEPDFDPVEQGAAFVTREVNVRRPAERRRLFFVHLNASARSLDAHAAFLSNANMVLNPADIENLPRLLERALRDFNDLYAHLNDALNITAL